jgi:CheY-like chemotaxis protein
VAGRKVLWTESVRSRVESGAGQFLARASLKAISAGTASVLLDVAAVDRPDLIILQPEPMELTVEQICGRIRADERTRSILILALAAADQPAAPLLQAGCTEVVAEGIGAQALQETIAAMLGLRLRRYPRYALVLPVARGRIFHEFLGYTNSVSEGGMGFETIARIRGGDHLPLRIYRNTEEKPITVTGRVAGVRPNIDTGIGYLVGVEFLGMAARDRNRLMELFPADPTLTWGPGGPADPVPPETPPRGSR